MTELGLRISREIFLFSQLNRNENYFMEQLRIIRKAVWDCLISF